jgi:hypothetical protein
MGKALKIFLIVLLIIIIILAAAGVYGYTKYQKVKPVIDLLNEKDQIASDITALTSGDCSKLPAVESRANEAEKALSNVCSDRVLVYFIKKYSPQNPCVIDLNQMKTNLQQIKSICDTKKKL